MRRMPKTARPFFVSAVGGRRLMCHRPRSDGPALRGRKLLGRRLMPLLEIRSRSVADGGRQKESIW